jgi:hypothetical protein
MANKWNNFWGGVEGFGNRLSVAGLTPMERATLASKKESELADLQFKMWLQENQNATDKEGAIADLAKKGIIQAPRNTVDYAQMMGQGQRPFTAYGQQFMTPPNIGGMKPILTIGDSGAIEQIGTIPKGGQFVSPSAMASPQEKADMQLAVAQQKPKTSESAGILAFAPTYEKSMNKIKSIVSKKDFDWGLFGAARAFSPMGFLTSTGGELEEIQLELQNLKKAAFGEGGKQLTPMEAKIVFSALDPSGKDKKLWLKQVDEANKVLQEKAKLVSGGASTKKNETDEKYQKYLKIIGGK